MTIYWQWKSKHKSLCYPTAKLQNYFVWQVTSANFSIIIFIIIINVINCNMHVSRATISACGTMWIKIANTEN